MESRVFLGVVLAERLKAASTQGSNWHSLTALQEDNWADSAVQTN